MNQYEGVPTAGVDTPYAHDFDEGEVHQLEHNHTDYLVRYDLRSQSAAAFKVLLVDEQHVILFNVEPEAEKEGCEKGHDRHRDTEKQTQHAKRACVACVVSKVEKPIIFKVVHFEVADQHL